MEGISQEVNMYDLLKLALSRCLKFKVYTYDIPTVLGLYVVV